MAPLPQMVLERGEKLELLVDKTDQLQTQAFQFQRTSRKLKDAMWWKKVRARFGPLVAPSLRFRKCLLTETRARPPAPCVCR